MKTQTVRLIDVFVLGPFMIWAGYEIGKKKDFAGMALALAGMATIGYNWNNYQRIERGEQAQQNYPVEVIENETPV